MCGSVFCFSGKFSRTDAFAPLRTFSPPWDTAVTPCSLPASYSFSSSSSDFLFLDTQPWVSCTLWGPDDSQSRISSSNFFPSLILIQLRQLLIMQIVFALSLGYLPSVTLSLSSSPSPPALHICSSQSADTGSGNGPVSWAGINFKLSETHFSSETNSALSYLRLISSRR